MVDQIFTLADGRSLGYCIYGNAGGSPVLYFHGTPSSRLELNLLRSYHVDLDLCLSENNIMLIAIDRPGMGRSSLHRNRSLLSFADDVYTLLHSLNVTSAEVLCWSGGGPYSLAIAWKYPAVIKQVYILCGFTHRFTGNLIKKMGRNKWYFLSAKFAPALLRFVMNRARNAELKRSLPQWLSGLPDPDYDLIRNPGKLQTISKYTLVEACRVNARGPVIDARLYFDDFGFEVSSIRQPIHFWWGTKDNAVIRPHAEFLEKSLPGSFLYYKEGEGHLSLYIHYFEEAIRTISRGSSDDIPKIE